jgi:Mg-chelatase subunit ChlD
VASQLLFQSNVSQLCTGKTNYQRALQLAFTLIEGTNVAKTKRHKIILFLTDGEPSGEPSDIMQTAYNHNSKLNFSVVIMTYGMHSK